MDAEARRALRRIQQCVATRRYRPTSHFTQRMDERGLFWPDLLGIIDDPDDVRDGGPEQWGRPKWIIAGRATDERPIELVCVLDTDKHGDLTVFITMY